MTFLDKLCNECSKVENPTQVPMNDGGPDNEGEVETVLAYNENNYSYNVVSNKESKDEVEESFFNYQIEDEIKVTPQTTLNPKVGGK